jgi:hypothetical protein
MIIDAYTFCWNEEIRLKYFLNLYSPLCRQITVFDNGSTDGSQHLASQYDNVIWNTETYGQGEIDDVILRDVKNNCWKDSRDADLVFVGDVDELLYHPYGLDKYFYSSLRAGYTVFRATAYDMVSTEAPSHEGNIYDDEKFRYGVRTTNCTRTSDLQGFRYDKSLVFSPQKIQEINYDFGAHYKGYSYKEPTGEVKELYDGELKLLHYKFLGEEFFCKRMRASGERLSAHNREKRYGFQYMESDENNRKLYREMFAMRERVL